MLTPSNPAFARADTPVLECVRLMRENKTGAVLVIADDAVGTLIGIFTEKDLIKHLEVIQQGGHWNRPVRTVMTSPVTSINSTQLDKASSVMLNTGVSFLPVLSTDPNATTQVAGIISVKDVFKELAAAKEEEMKLAPPTATAEMGSKIRIACTSEDPDFTLMIEKLLYLFFKAKLARAGVGAALGQTFNTILYDIDGVAEEDWRNNLKSLNKNPFLALIIVAYTVEKYDANAKTTLEKLKLADRFCVLHKPAGFGDLLTKLQQAAASSTPVPAPGTPTPPTPDAGAST